LQFLKLFFQSRPTYFSTQGTCHHCKTLLLKGKFLLILQQINRNILQSSANSCVLERFYPRAINNSWKFDAIIAITLSQQRITRHAHVSVYTLAGTMHFRWAQRAKHNPLSLSLATERARFKFTHTQHPEERMPRSSA